MSPLIESKKLKRTGYLPAFLAGGFLAAAFPVCELADDGDVEHSHFHLRCLYDVPHGICR